MHVRIRREIAKWLTECQVRDDIERHILYLAGKVERLIRRYILALDQVQKCEDVVVNLELKIVDLLARVLLGNHQLVLSFSLRRVPRTYTCSHHGAQPSMDVIVALRQDVVL